MLGSQLCKRAILGGLKGVCLKMDIVIFEIKGKGIEGYILLLQLFLTNGSYQRTIQSTREKTTNGDIGNHLPLDAVPKKKPDIIYGFGIRIPVRKRFQLAKVFPLKGWTSFAGRGVKVEIFPGKNFFHARKTAFAKSASRTEGKYFIPGFLVCSGTNAIRKQGFWLRCKYQDILIKMEKQWLYEPIRMS